MGILADLLRHCRFVTIALALHVCKKVSIFGFGKADKPVGKYYQHDFSGQSYEHADPDHNFESERTALDEMLAPQAADSSSLTPPHSSREPPPLPNAQLFEPH